MGDSIIADTATYGLTISWDNLDGSTGVTTVSDLTLGQEGDGGEDQENEAEETEEGGNN